MFQQLAFIGVFIFFLSFAGLSQAQSTNPDIEGPHALSTLGSFDLLGSKESRIITGGIKRLIVAIPSKMLNRKDAYYKYPEPLTEKNLTKTIVPILKRNFQKCFGGIPDDVPVEVIPLVSRPRALKNKNEDQYKMAVDPDSLIVSVWRDLYFIKGSDGNDEPVFSLQFFLFRPLVHTEMTHLYNPDYHGQALIPFTLSDEQVQTQVIDLFMNIKPFAWIVRDF